MASIEKASPGIVLERRGRAARFALLIMLVVAVVAAISTVGEYTFVSNAAAGKTVSMEQAEAIDLRQRLIAIIYFAGLITTGILFIRWQRAAYDGAASGLAGAMPYSKRWTIWGWIVPIVSLFVPYRIIKEIYACATRNTSASLVAWWWFFWLVGNMADSMSFRLSLTGSLPDLAASSAIALAGRVMAVPAALIAAKIIADVDSGMYEPQVLLANEATMAATGP